MCVFFEARLPASMSVPFSLNHSVEQPHMRERDQDARELHNGPCRVYDERCLLSIMASEEKVCVSAHVYAFVCM